MADVKLTAIYYDGNRELRRSATAKIAKVADKARVPVKLEAVNVPNFTRYELYVEYGTTTSYGSSSTLNTSIVTSHSVALSGLTASRLS